MYHFALLSLVAFYSLVGAWFVGIAVVIGIRGLLDRRRAGTVREGCARGGLPGGPEEMELASAEGSLAAKAPAQSVDREAIRRLAGKQIRRLPELLREDVVLARAELTKHGEAIRMVPDERGGERFYTAESKWDLLGSAPSTTSGG